MVKGVRGVFGFVTDVYGYGGHNQYTFTIFNDHGQKLQINGKSNIII